MRTNGNPDPSKMPVKGQSGQATAGQNAATQGSDTLTRREQARDLWRGRRDRSWGPFGMIGRMFEDLDRAFGLDVDRTPGRSPAGQELATLFRPDLEVFERDGKLVLRADLPGLRQEDVKIEVDEGILTISGERKSDYETEREGYYESERSYGYFKRSVRLPEGTNPDEIQAKFDGGVLEIEAPIAEKKPRGRTVPIGGAKPK
jgi:HSP20 family protein